MSTLRKAVLAGLGLGLAVLMPAAAIAANAYATTDVNERAGPGTDYPVVTVIPAGSTLTIFGCLPEIAWCDVAFAGLRGWVQGSYLQAFYESRRVPVVAYAPRLGVPIVTFSIVYWDDHYRDRPFYRERARFVRLHEGPRGINYRTTPDRRVMGPVGKGPRFVGKGPRYKAPAGPRQFAKVPPNRLRYAKYGKAPKPKVVKAKVVKAKGKPIYANANAKALRMTGKKPPRKCVMLPGRRAC